MSSFTVVNGYLTKDVETRKTESGLPVTKFSVASREQRKVNDAWESYTEWYDCVMFGKEGLIKFLKKGTFVTLVCKLQTSRYTKDGVEMKYKNFMVQEINGFINKEQATGGYITPAVEAPEAYSVPAAEDDPF